MKTLALSILITVTSLANAQHFKFAPKWQPSKVIALEYIYTDREEKKSGDVKQDTIHADIELKMVRETEDFYYFDWKYVSYYQDIADNSSAYKKMTGPLVAKIATQTPILFKVDKTDWEVKVINEEAIDSIKKIAVAETMAALPKKDEDAEAGAELVLALGAETQMEKRVYGVINDYFALYKNEERKLVLNEKKDLAQEMSSKDKEQVSKLLGDVEGYLLLDDKTPGYYNLHIEIKMDMGKMMNMFANMAKNMDKGKKKSKKGDNEPMISTPILTITTADIKASKDDMLMQSYTQTITMDGKDTAIGSNANGLEILRVKP
jgi:hypothetical protein